MKHTHNIKSVYIKIYKNLTLIIIRNDFIISKKQILKIKYSFT